jgi:hypothetical protein
MTMPLIKILSSKVARNNPASPLFVAAFLICPRIPETVFNFAPSNLATSNCELNIPLT